MQRLRVSKKSFFLKTADTVLNFEGTEKTYQIKEKNY